MIVVNGQSSDVGTGATVADVLEALGLTVEARGVAVAVDGAVVPRAEVLTAMQGG